MHGVSRLVLEGQSIQSAIDESSSGDVIEVGEGVYPEELVIDGKAIEIRSQSATKPRALGLTLKNINGTLRV